MDLGGSFCILLIVLAMGSKVTSGTVTDNAVKLAKANNAFAIHLYQTLQAANEGRNLFFSPLSISTALGMTHLGARGTTSSQMSKVLHFRELEESQLHESFKQLNSLLYGSANEYILKAANKLYGKSGYRFLQDFLDNTANLYESAFESVTDFADPAAAKRINDWVSEQTAGLIQDLIGPGFLNSFTSLVLVNAIYFKGSWAKQFNPENTEPGVFKLPNKNIHLNMMRQSGKYQLSDDKTRRCFVLEMPYVDEDLSMLAVLPWDDDGLASVEAQISQEAFDFWESDLQEENVRIQFPKFKMEDEFALSSTLVSMGMTEPFDADKANFEGITGDRSLHISEVLHKAFVEVNEEGSEAAAASAVIMLEM